MRAISEEWRFPGQGKDESHSCKKEHEIILRTDLMVRKGEVEKGWIQEWEEIPGQTKVSGLKAQT